jgi:aspartyl protease family protein
MGVEKQAGKGNGLTTGLKWAPLGIVVFWMLVMGLLYVGMKYYLQPRPVVVSAAGDLVIPRARDGHFYVSGQVNGMPVKFLIDTGASLVTVSTPFALEAGLASGVSTVFRTANGDLPGRIVSGVPVSIGPMAVSSVRIGVGLVGLGSDEALLGQSFLSRFDMVLTKEQMLLRKRQTLTSP